MSTNLIPRVSITEVTTRLATPKSNQVIIGIIGTSETGTANVVTAIYSVADAVASFGLKAAYGASLIPMIERAFTEGASVIKAISIGTPTLNVATAGTEGALTADSVAGSLIVTVADATIYTAGDVVYIGPDSTYAKAEKKIVDTAVGTTVTFTTALEYTHYIGENAKIVAEKIDSDYTDAIEAMKVDVDKSLVVCESNSDATATALIAMCEDSTFSYNTPCVYIQSVLETDDEASAIVKAKAHNDDRAILVYPLLVDYNDRILTPGENAAASAGLIAGQGIPKLNLNFSVFTSFKGASTIISDVNTLIAGGVSPIEVKYETLHFVKIVTTSTNTAGIPDSTWREASIRLNVDVMEKAITATIQKLYMQKGNTKLVRDSIQQKIISLLAIYEASQIIVADENTNTPAYKTPVVSTDINDATKVNIAIEVSPGKPLNYIQLNFNIVI